jgi:outer membrane protein insertion porin family
LNYLAVGVWEGLSGHLVFLSTIFPQDFFKRSAWKPVPSGNGQTLSMRIQSNGLYYQSYNLSFTEPWLGGKKPNAFSFGVYYSVQTNGFLQKMMATE